MEARPGSSGPHRLFGSTTRLGRLGRRGDSSQRGLFEVLLTLDKRLRYQQNVGAGPVAVLVIDSPPSRYSDLLSVIPAVLERLEAIRPGEVVVVTPDQKAL